jgi:hypothetical protein
LFALKAYQALVAMLLDQSTLSRPSSPAVTVVAAIPLPSRRPNRIGFTDRHVQAHRKSGWPKQNIE